MGRLVLLLVGCLFFSMLLEGIHYLLSRGERRSEHILLRSAGCFFFGILGAYLTLSLIGGYLFDPFSLGRGDYGFFFFCFFIYAILFTGLGFLFPRPGKTRWKRAVLLFSLTLTLAFFLEVFLFNGRHYESLFSQKTPLSYSASELTALEETHHREDDTLAIPASGGSFALCGIDAEVHSFYLELGEHKGPVEFTVSLSDEAYGYGYRVSPSVVAHPSVPRSLNLSLSSNGRLKELLFTFSASGEEVLIKRLYLNLPPAFRFEPLRFGAAFGILLLLSAGKLYGLFSYLPKRRERRAALLLITLCCLSYAGWNFYSNLAPERRSEREAYLVTEVSANHSDAYIQQIDAFQKGQLHLDIEADERLTALSNPYDKSQRDQAGISYQWDRAYYEGRYYSYFGVAPLFTCYYPIHLLTGGYPTEAVATLFFVLFFLIGAALLYERLLTYYHSRLPLPLYLLGYLAVIFGSGVFWAMRRPLCYEVAALSGLCFLTYFLYFSWKCLTGRWYYFLLTGIFAVLLAASRPNLLLYALFPAVLLIGFLLHHRREYSKQIRSFTLLFLPILIGAAGLMSFNFLRFGSPFEFGVRYQLTVSDISYNSLFTFGNLVPALYHYLFQPPYLSLSLPYLELSNYPYALGRYYFLSPCLGAAFLPLTLAAPAAGRGIRRQEKRLSGLLGLLFFLLPLLMVYLDFSLAGVHYRYALDFLFPLLLGGMIGISKLYKNNSILRYVFYLALVVTLLAGLCLGLSGEYHLFYQQNPEEFLRLKMALEWWR